MNWHLQQLKYAMGLGGIMSFYGIVYAIVWVSGTYLNWQVSSRVVVIALVTLSLPFALIIGFVASRRNKKKDKAAEEDDDKPEAKTDKAKEKPADEKGPQKLGKPTGTYEDIDKSSAEVVQFLKDSNLGEGGKDSIYSLPWYVIAGTPKSGKSSLVIGSSLNFQSLPSQRQSELKFVRPTRGVDWRVTADAVFIDTAGRYQTEGVDQDEWASLIETIKKHRPQRPLDGFLLVVNAEQILESRESEVEQMAKVLRSRLDELMERTKVRFPVYLIFTNADSIEGFKDSFSRSKKEGKNLVWGSTIPLEKSENGQTLFDSEYGLLQDAVMKRRILRLSAPFPPVSQLRIFNFPLHFGSARRRIGAFVSTLFRPNPFSKSPFLRGFYFTSAPAARSNGGRPAVQTVGTTYFTQRFFRDVLLRDKDLVRATQLQTKRPPILGWALTAIGAFLTLLFLVMSGVSLYNNKQLLNTSVEKGKAVIAVVKDDKSQKINPLDKKPAQVQEELDKIEALRDFLENNLDKYDREGVPIHLQFGLYTGDTIYKDSLLPIYFGAIEQRFKVPMVARIEEDLKKFSKSNPVANASNVTDEETEVMDKHYNLLKAYLMLTQKYKDKAESTHLINTLKDYWVNESKIPDNLRAKAENQLEFWAKQADRENFPPVTLDDQLVSDTRAKLKSFPAANRFYKAEVGRINEVLEKKGVKVTAQNIINDNGADSGYIEGNYEIPAAYTREGYVMLKESLSSEDTKLDQPDWVMGEEVKEPTASGGDVEKVEKLYLRDYAVHWTAFAQDIKLKPFTRDNIEFAKNTLDSVSSANSAITVITREISRNTNFSGKTEEAGYAWYNPIGWWSSIKKWLDSTPEIKTDGDTEVEREFSPLFSLFRVEANSKGDATKPLIEKYQSIIGNVSKDFKPLSVSKIADIARNLDKDGKDPFPVLSRSSKDVDDLLKNFDTTAGKALANLYRQPLDNLKALFGADKESQIRKKWDDEIFKDAQNIEKSYPFSSGGDEINIKDLSAFLNPKDGKLSLFYNERLKEYFEGEDENIKLKEGVNVEFNEEFITYLKNAFRLRRILYGGNPKPEFKYGLALTQLNNVVVEGTIDGSPITSQGTGSANFTFPASSGENGVIIKFDSTGESTPPADGSANTSNSNVSTPTSNAVQDNSGCKSGSNPIRCPGTWGLFRFFEAGNPSKEGEGYKLNYSYNGKTITMVVTPNGGDLFDKTMFTSLKAPNAILK